jgi:hypothetical protein
VSAARGNVVDCQITRNSAAVYTTTNLSFKQWGTVFPGAACIVALVDRFATGTSSTSTPSPGARSTPAAMTHAIRPTGRGKGPASSSAAPDNAVAAIYLRISFSASSTSTNSTLAFFVITTIGAEMVG